MQTTTISRVRGYEILDSRGNPTVQAEVTLECGVTGVAAVPRFLIFYSPCPGPGAPCSPGAPTK